MRIFTRGSAALFGLVTFVTAIVIELVSASGPLFDKPFNEGVIKVAVVALGTYVAPGIVVGILLGGAALAQRLRSNSPVSTLSGSLIFASVALLAIVRLLMQALSGEARFMVGLLGAAIAVAVLVLVVAFAAGRSAPLTALGLTAGGVLAAGVSLTLGTWDAIWRSGVQGWAPTLILVLLALGCAWLLRTEPATRAPRRLWALGPFLAMTVMIIANPAYLAAQLGLPLSVVAIALALSLVASAILVLQTQPRALAEAEYAAHHDGPTSQTRRIHPMNWLSSALLIALFAVVLFPLLEPGEPAPVLIGASMFLVILLVPALAAGALASAWSAPVPEHSTRSSLLRLAGTGTVVGLGVILPLLVYQLDYDVPLPVPNAVVPLITIAALAAAGLRAGSRSSATAATPTPQPIGPQLPRERQLVLGLVLAVGLIGLLGAGLNTLPKATPAEQPAPDDVVLLNWNLHFGVTQEPGVGLDEMAQVINDSGARVVTLQEVSRGWVMGGRADMATYLARATGMRMILAPAADRQFTNMILVDPALGPIRDVVRTNLPYGDGPQWRSAITGTIAIPGLDQGLTVTSAHLQHRTENTPTRLEQLDVLLDADLASGPAILAGDFNSEPGWPEIDRVVDAGYISAQDTAGNPTLATFPSWDPNIRIDWIWGHDVTFTNFDVLAHTPSDHRALRTVVHLKPVNETTEAQN